MVLEGCLQDLVVRFKQALDSKDKALDCFCKYGVQVEGWLKGEFLCFLHNEKDVGRVAHFDREVSMGMGRKKADFMVKMSASSGVLEAWIELKHWLIGYQRGTQYNAQFYFGDRSSVGIKPDAEKLSEISNGGKFFLVLTTANCGMNDWSDGVNKFNRKFAPLHLESLTIPADFPSSYYLGLLKVTK